jgi:hypothetical protein
VTPLISVKSAVASLRRRTWCGALAAFAGKALATRLDGARGDRAGET